MTFVISRYGPCLRFSRLSSHFAPASLVSFYFFLKLPDTLSLQEFFFTFSSLCLTPSFLQVCTLATSSPPSVLISWGIVSVGLSQTSPENRDAALQQLLHPCLLFLPQYLPLADTLGTIHHRLFRFCLHVLTCTPLTTGVFVGYV